jgi:integrase
MAGKLNRLTARQAETISKPGRHADGGDLYLKVRPGGSRQWVMMFATIEDTPEGKRRKQIELSLGPAGEAGLSLADARAKAATVRAQRFAGLDPKAERRKAAAVPTFGEMADAYIKSHASAFKSLKHALQWQTTLGAAYCAKIRSRPVKEIDTEAVLSVLKPIWSKVPETAARLRGRIERVMAAAIVARHHPGPNPAVWRGHLDALLPKRQKLTRGHHAAMPYDDMPKFIAALRARQSLAALALEITILTACRTSEVLGARWDEIDLDKAIWIIPKERMKAGIAHRVPLSPRAVEILQALPRISDFVFAGQKPGKPLSGMAMEMQLRRMERDDITVHGFRSTFRDWAAEQTAFPHTTAEHALAHRISDKAESAYLRGDELERRRKLMEAWAGWCEPKAGENIIQFTKEGRA